MSDTTQQSSSTQHRSDEKHVLLGYNHEHRTTMLAPFPTDAVDRPLHEFSSDLHSATNLGLYMKPTKVDGIYDDLEGVIESMERHHDDWDDVIALLQQFTE